MQILTWVLLAMVAWGVTVAEVEVDSGAAAEVEVHSGDAAEVEVDSNDVSIELLRHRREDVMTLCGRNLAVARMLVCYEQVQKRSIPDSTTETPVFARLYPALQQSFEEDDSEARPRIKREGLVEQCCLSPCTINELRDYC